MPRDIDLKRDDGRTVCVRIAGANNGPLVIYMHGSPSSRLDIDYLDARSARRGVRLAAFDRPGYGGSTLHRFDFASVAADAAAVADHLGAPTFAVMGQSSGAGYAVGTAAYLPDRVSAMATGGSDGPIEPGTKTWALLSEPEQRGVLLAGTDDQEAERLLAEADRPYVERQLAIDDAGLLAYWRAAAGIADRRALDDGFDAVLVPTLRESLRQGQAGWARDNVVRMPQWEIDTGAVRCPATFWLGEQDAGNPEGGQWLATLVPHGEVRLLPDYGHFVIFEVWDDVLDSLGV
ncbi:MAG: alpha/beta hydrolase [Chloroflexota bacterium]